MMAARVRPHVRRFGLISLAPLGITQRDRRGHANRDGCGSFGLLLLSVPSINITIIGSIVPIFGLKKCFI
jgi:hypothetical protein